MFSTKQNNDEQAAAQLLWQLKAIATKEVEKVSLPYSCIDSFYTNPSEGRGRTVSLDSGDLGMKAVSPVFSYVPHSYMDTGKSSFLLDTPEKPIEQLDHHDWGATAPKRIAHSPLIGTEEGTKHGKRKRESHVGLTTKTGIIRCTLRKKVSSFSQHISAHSGTVRLVSQQLTNLTLFYRFESFITHSSRGSNTQR